MRYNELDQTAKLFILKDKHDQIIATMRLNIGLKTFDSPKRRQMLQLDKFPLSHYKVGYISQIVVAREHRYKGNMLRLFKHLYLYAVTHDVQILFGFCEKKFIHLYKKLGCHPYGDEFIHEHIGPAQAMVIMPDNSLFTRIKSPLRNLASDKFNQPDLWRWVKKTFPHAD